MSSGEPQYEPSRDAVELAFGVLSDGKGLTSAVREAYTVDGPKIREEALHDAVNLLRAEATGPLLTDSYWDGVRFAAQFIEQELLEKQK